jgi:hypothetical protein
MKDDKLTGCVVAKIHLTVRIFNTQFYAVHVNIQDV